jgi:tetratricopeptide (TPR) repeat protein
MLVKLFPKATALLLVCLGFLCAAEPSVGELIEAGHWKRARSILLDRIKANPNDAQAHAWLAKVATGFGDLDTAIREGERAVELAPSSAFCHGVLAESFALMADRSSILKGLAYVHRMKREIDATLAIDPQNVDTLLVEMVFSFKAPVLAGGDRQKAWRIAADLVRISPAWGYLGQARLMQLQGDEAGTEAALKKAVEAAPSFYRARALLATFYCGDRACPAPATAEAHAREAIALDPGAEAAYEVLARAYVAEKRWGDLDAILERAENSVPDNIGPYYAAANRLIETGQDFDRAERYLRHYLSQPAEGREPTAAEAHRLLGDMYEHAGRKSDAFRELELAVRLQPDFEPARRELNRLRHF